MDMPREINQPVQHLYLLLYLPLTYIIFGVVIMHVSAHNQLRVETALQGFNIDSR